jgi:ABC-type phosphate transport system substrate-binding protein
VPIKGTETKVSVYQELGSGKNTAKVFIATVDLGKLGKDVKAQRRKMRMQHLYVLGQVPVGFGPVPEQDEEEQ